MTQLKERNESPKEDPENGISDMVAPCGSQPPLTLRASSRPCPWVRLGVWTILVNNYGLSLADSHSF
jgi:hypothetical protein